MNNKSILSFLILLSICNITSGNTITAKGKLKEKKLVIKDIPVRICYKEDHPEKKLLILSHGFSGNKDNWSEKMKALAEMGYYTVALDNRYHGERKGPAIYEKVMTKDSLISVLSLRKVIDETACDITTLIDYFIANETVDTSNIGMIGISLGGFISYASMVKDERISFIAPLISSPYWDDIPQNPVFLNTKETVKELKEYSILNSPANKPECFYKRNILAQIGLNDTHFDTERVIEFYNLLNTKYGKDNSGFKLKTYNVGHEVTEPMWRDVLNWLTSVNGSVNFKNDSTNAK